VKISGYFKAVKAKLQEKGADADTMTAFEKGAQTYVKEKLLPNFKDFEFYTGESMDPDGLYVSTKKRLLACSKRLLLMLLLQCYPPQLPRGRCHSLHHCLEARSRADEGLSMDVQNVAHI
jgi:hypothetical protein